jgi:hypothetical protein
MKKQQMLEVNSNKKVNKEGKKEKKIRTNDNVGV